MSERKKSDRRTARLRNPLGEGRRLREELIAAADRLLVAGTDPDSLSLRAVAREAGVSAPSVYLQFENKDALVRAVVTEHFVRFQEAINAAVATGTDPASRLLNGCLAYGRFAAEQPGSYRVIFETRKPEIWAHLPVEQVPGMNAFQILVDSVAECIDAGVARPGDPFQIAADIWVALHGMVSLRHLMTAFPWPDPDVQVTRMVETLTGIPDMQSTLKGDRP